MAHYSVLHGLSHTDTLLCPASNLLCCHVTEYSINQEEKNCKFLCKRYMHTLHKLLCPASNLLFWHVTAYSIHQEEKNCKLLCKRYMQ